jgi:group I intron endonuclease
MQIMEQNKNSGVIYMVKCKTTGMMYIGQAVSFTKNGRKYGSKGRWINHRCAANNGCNKKKCSALVDAINTYGEDDFELSDLLICNREFLDSYEQKFIDLYGTMYPKGYNLQSGGLLGSKTSLKTREQMSNNRRFKHRRTDQPMGHETIINAMKEAGIDSLPMYVTVYLEKKKYKSKVTYGYRVNVRKPNSKFLSLKTQTIPLSERIKTALEYLKTITNDDRYEEENPHA